jgi:SAM-dependent methyltransferase
MSDEQARHQREIELHRTLSDQYDIRHGFDFTLMYHRHWNHTLLTLAEGRNGLVIDCGCGSGILLDDLAQRFEGAAGIDISAAMLAHIAPTTRQQAHIAVASMEALPFAANSFDLVFCRGSLHHAADLNRALANLRSILKPGGLLILSEPCADSWLLRLPRWYWRTFSSRFDDDHHALSSAGLAAQLAGHDLMVTRQRRFGFVAFPLCGLADILPIMRYLPFRRALTRWLIRLDEICARIPLVNRQAWHIMMRAECRKSS